MSLCYDVRREPDASEVTAAEKRIYATFISYIAGGNGPTRSILRTARDTGVSRRRVLEIIRKINPDNKIFAPRA